MKGFADKMTDHQVLTNTTSTTSPTMGLQAHPCSNKRTIEGLEEPAGRTQQNHNHHYNNNNNNNQQVYQVHGGPRAAKQQCTIRVGLEAPDHLTTLVPSNCNPGTESVTNNNNSWYRDVQQQHAPDYETYVNGFTAAEVRASTPYSTSSTYYSSTSTHSTENVAVPAVEYSSYANNGSNNVQYSSQNVYQNLTSMLPVANGSGESLADRFERVCSSPRPYVQYSGREEPAGYHYGTNNESRSDERYWTFGYTAACPRKTGPAGYAKCNSNYNGYNGENGFGHHKATANGYQQQQQLVGGGQTIQRDENGKSYLELGAKAAVQPDWTRPQMWPANNNGQQQQHYAVAPPTPLVKSCSKCGHVLLNPARSLPQPCYRHQRLSVLSLSMLKLNRYRQCSDPSLHRSVLICNTLRHIEDEMEREGPTETSSAPTSSSSSTANSCDTCCCSHCGTVFNKPDNYGNDNSTANNANNSVGVYDTTPETNFINAGEYGGSQSSATTAAATTTTTIAASTKSNSVVVQADEDDSGFGDEDSRDIDWSSVFSMSTASGFDASPGNSSSSDSYLCDSNSSDPSLFAGAELVSELGLSNWKTSHCGSSTNGHSGGATSWTSDSSDFSGVRWKSELGDELEGFVHILVGS
ncbi:LOW QUALITY PROTEIN: myb-like protein AA [Daphnia magna]|uniref:LOW QUALITY PROTEIN: myb-like protein AA n=1 Tax=Daphnia magna TaxID=35525 RepID=UPI001E1BBDDA|nr:LOW QUALITY PROTEIN: myb-like protein AA [Daphnia magna]